MRFRPLALSAAVTALLLTGCAGGATPDDSGSPAATGGADLCAAKVDAGDASDAVKAEGEVGSAPTVTFTAPLEITDIESTVLTEGDGDPVVAGDLVEVAFVGLDAESGAELGSVGYSAGEILPQQISADSGLGQFLGCSPVGTRVAVTLPASEATADAPATPGQVYVMDLLSVVPTAAWGEPQTPTPGLPTVTLDDDGAPTVDLPEGDMPTEFELGVTKRGDGATVDAGDQVMVQYHGVSWNTGEVFDQSWGGQPFTFSTAGGVVQGFADAVVGQTVGSQVIAVLPPALAYGEGEINDSDLTGQTLVFVVDILGVQKAAAGQ